MIEQEKVSIGSELTTSQLLIWTGQELNPNSPLYNMAIAFDLQATISVEIFKQAFDRLVSESESMRTVFFLENGSPRQQVLKTIPYSLEILDWSERSDLENELQLSLKQRTQNIFDLTEIAFDSALIKLSSNRFVWYLNQHHLITDAWGFTVQYKALFDYYKNLDEGIELNQPLGLFSEFLNQQKDLQDSPKYSEAKSYWEELNSNIPPMPRFYGFNQQVLVTDSERITLELGTKRSDRLRALTKETDLRNWSQHLALYNIFATVLFTYLHRIGGQDRVQIGTPSHNRSTETQRNTPGVFIEFFPLEVSIDKSDNFQMVHKKVTNQVNGFLKHSVPGTTSAELNRNFHAVLNYIPAGFADFDDYPMKSNWIHTGHCDPRHHIRLHVYDFDHTGNIQLHFDLNLQVFDPELRTRVARHFLHLLDSFIEDRTQKIAAPSLVSGEETKSIEALLKDESKGLETEGSILESFQNQVTSRGEAVAISFGNQQITFQSLDRRSNQLANLLFSKQIGKGDRVVLKMNRSPELIIAILAVLKTGAAYVPVDPKIPEERWNYLLEQLEPKQIVTNAEDLWGQVDAMSQEWEEIDVLPESAAYIMFTSGTSGDPKGVVVSHASLSNYVHWASSFYVENQPRSYPLFTTPSFDLTVTSIYLPLVTGGTIVVYPENDFGPDLSLLEVLKEDQVDIVKLTPSHFSLVDLTEITSSRIKTLIIGGEELSPALAQELFDTFGSQISIFNEYGPTEATVGCVVHQLSQKDLGAPAIPIGRPVANTSVYLLDSNQHPVPKGVTGEIYLGGPGVSEGYWNRDDLTVEKFIRNPLNAEQKLYRTGDLARLDREGNLSYLGRSDRQVKLGGIRVELGEIESSLTNHPHIRQAAVTIRRRNLEESDHITYCTECGIPSNYPSIAFDHEGVCDLCRSFTNYQRKVKAYFKQEEELQKIIKEGQPDQTPDYHCIMLLSGGKDSTYALARLVDMGFKVLAFTLDNGYISPQAKANIKRVVKALGVDHVFGQTEAMNAIFVDSINRHCNVCNGCFKTIYTLSTKLAVEERIPFIVTGLSRGQFFETRLTEELFRDHSVDFEKIDDTILQARKAYHQTDDAVNQLLDVSVFKDGKAFDQVQYLDFYRYSPVSLAEMYEYLDQQLPWVRPTDTGRSTNCVINQVGIYVHRKVKGYSNYAFPYSWDVRVGHKTRDASIDEVNEEIDEKEVFRIMEEIGYKPEQVQTGSQQITAYYTVNDNVTHEEIRDHLSKTLADYMIPTQFISMEEMPMTVNGKVDYDALAEVTIETGSSGHYKAPSSQIEEMLAEIWTDVLKVSKVGVADNFIHLGGNSLMAIQLMSQINERFNLDLSLNSIFEFPTIEQFGDYIDKTISKLLDEEG